MLAFNRPTITIIFLNILLSVLARGTRPQGVMKEKELEPIKDSKFLLEQNLGPVKF
jgi:hypothetical protein